MKKLVMLMMCWGTLPCYSLPAWAAGAAALQEKYVESFPQEVRGFASMDWREKRRTLEQVVEKGREAVPCLVAGLKKSEELDRSPTVPAAVREVGRHCAIALGRIGAPSTVPDLIEALNHPDSLTRREVVRALATLQDNRAIIPLAALWFDPQEDKVNKREAAFALVSFGADAIAAAAGTEISGEHDRLATAALLRIALEDLDAVTKREKASTDAAEVGRLQEALAELKRRQNHWPNLPELEEVERRSQALEELSDFRGALHLWETVLDSGLYPPEADARARIEMTRIKDRVGAKLFEKPVSTWRNKVFILAKYDGELPGNGGRQSRHVAYSLANSEIATIKKRFALLEEFARQGSCGALRLDNDIVVLTEPWKLFRPSHREGEQSKARFQITRPDLDGVFHYKENYLEQGYDCVFFVMRGDLKSFEMDGGAAGGFSVLNAQRTPFDNLNIKPQCHEWLHILHGTIWERGGFDWMQCLPLHDQLRDLRLHRSWMTGRRTREEDVFVTAMRKYITTSMWESIGNRAGSASRSEETLDYD